jgi:hypothetical protein
LVVVVGTVGCVVVVVVDVVVVLIVVVGVVVGVVVVVVVGLADVAASALSLTVSISVTTGGVTIANRPHCCKNVRLLASGLSPSPVSPIMALPALKFVRITQWSANQRVVAYVWIWVGSSVGPIFE